MLAEPDYTATGKTRIGQFKGPSGTNTSTPESAARDQAAVASRDELTDTFFPGMFGYLVAHSRRSFFGHLIDLQDQSAYRALTDADLARREILEAISGTSERAAYNQTHASYFTTIPGIQDWFLLPEAEVPAPAQIYNPANYHCGSYAKFTTDSLVAATSESTEAGAATYPQLSVANEASSTLAAPTVARLPSFAYAARPGVVRYNMPRPELGAQFREDTYLRFDGTAYSASFYAGTTGWSQGVEYANNAEPDVTKTPSVRGFGPGLLSFSVFGTNAAQSVTARNLTGPVMLSESDGAQTPGTPTANWLDRAEEFAHPAIVGIARRAGTSADCAGRFTTVRQRYAGSTKVVETKTAGVLSALSVNTRGFVNQELNFKDANGAYLTGAANKAKVDLLKSAATKVCDAFPAGLLVSPYLCAVATLPSNNMGYGTMDLVRQAPNGTQCTELPLPFTLEFNRNYVARAAYLEATVNLKAPNPGGLSGFTPPVILKSTTDNVVFSQLDEVIPVYHDVREVVANAVFEPDAAGSSKVYVRVTGGTWQRLAWGVAGATAGPVAAQEIFVARYQGGLHIRLTGAARKVRITEPPDLTSAETGNHGATQNVLVSLLPDPAQVPAGGYAGTYGAANAVNFALTYRLLPRETNALPL